MEYLLKVNPRRKRVSISVDEEGKLIVKAPPYITNAQIEGFVNQHENWIQKQKNQVISKPKLEDRFQPGSEHWYLGKAYPLKILENAETTTVSFEQDHWIFKTRAVSSFEETKKYLDSWYRQQAQEIFLECFREQYAFMQPLLSLPPVPKISIRAMTSRWGSCSSQRNVSLNLYLIHLPISCLEYIIAHELCHLKEMNHSARFHALMDKSMPDWRLRKAELKKCAREIPFSCGK